MICNNHFLRAVDLSRQREANQELFGRFEFDLYGTAMLVDDDLAHGQIDLHQGG